LLLPQATGQRHGGSLAEGAVHTVVMSHDYRGPDSRGGPAQAHSATF
jgi:hypothetical protein